MSTETIEHLERLRRCLAFSREGVAVPIEGQFDYYNGNNRGLRSGLGLAIEAIDNAIRAIEAGDAAAGEEIREQYRKATAPMVGTFRIDASPESLAEQQRMIDSGDLPF